MNGTSLGFSGVNAFQGMSDFQVGSGVNLQSVVDAVPAGSTLHLTSGATYGEVVINKNLTIDATGAFINGTSPALTVSAGTTILTGGTYTNTVADGQPAILVDGTGSLTLHGGTINGSSGANATLVEINTTGSVDLGTTGSFGNNTFNINATNVLGSAYIDAAGPQASRRSATSSIPTRRSERATSTSPRC